MPMPEYDLNLNGHIAWKAYPWVGTTLNVEFNITLAEISKK